MDGVKGREAMMTPGCIQSNSKKDLSDITVTLFFTAGVSLGTWAEVGNLSREVELYHRLIPHLRRINFVTYGSSVDLSYADQLAGIQLLPVSWHRWRRWTLRQLLKNHGQELQKTDVLKTNQIPGAEVAIEIKRRLGKKLITRCGYLYSRHVEYEQVDEATIRLASELERRAFQCADLAMVTSERDRLWAADRYHISREKIRVVPNYVNTDVFQPMQGVEKLYDLVYVGRSGHQKNLFAFLAALRLLKERGKTMRLMLVGGCTQDKELRQIAEGLQVHFVKNVSNHELPLYLCQTRMFVIPSLYEGHSKALLEAMSCGMPCVGTNVIGVKEEICHLRTGFLCEPDPESIAEAIQTVLADEALQRILGENARRYVMERYSIDRVLQLELAAYQEVVRA